MSGSHSADNQAKETPTEIKEELTEATTDYGSLSATQESGLRQSLICLEITTIVNNPLRGMGEPYGDVDRYNPIRVGISRCPTDTVDNATIEAFDESLAEHDYVKVLSTFRADIVLDEDAKLQAEMQYRHESEARDEQL